MSGAPCHPFFLAQPIAGGVARGVGAAVPQMGAVVLVNKLHEEKVTTDILFTLFGVYGDVLRVKIMYNKRSTALVQYASSQSAQLAVQHLTGAPLFGNELVVQSSKHAEVKALKGELEGSELTKDYSNSDGHRFKKMPFINKNNLHSPSKVLFLANIHESCTEQQLRDLFQVFVLLTDLQCISTVNSNFYLGIRLFLLKRTPPSRIVAAVWLPSSSSSRSTERMLSLECPLSKTPSRPSSTCI